VSNHRQATARKAATGKDLEVFRPQRPSLGNLQSRHPAARFGGGERVCLGKPLAELEIRLLAVGAAQAAELGAGARSGLHPQGHVPALPQRTAFWFGPQAAAILEREAELGAAALDAD